MSIPPATDSEKKEIALATKDLPDGTTSAYFCPRCKAPHENKLYATRSGKSVAFQCKRAACGLSGYIGVHKAQPPKEKEVKLNPYTKETRNLTVQEINELVAKYWIFNSVLKDNTVSIDTYGNLVLPLYPWLGPSWGIQVKRWKGNPHQKTMLYRHSPNYPTLHFPKLGVAAFPKKKERPIVIVEDVLSSMKVIQAQDMARAAAILGTHLHTNVIEELQSCTNHLIIMLDPDAYNKALSIKKNLKALFRKIDVVQLDTDPKDTPCAILEQKIRQVILNGK